MDICVSAIHPTWISVYPPYIRRGYLCIRHTSDVDICVSAIHLTWISAYPPLTCHFFGFCSVPRPMAMFGSHRVTSSPVIFPSKVASTSLVVMTCDTSSTVRRHSHKHGTRKTETRRDVTTPRKDSIDGTERASQRDADALSGVGST